MTNDLLTLLDDCISRARKAGADAADALAFDSQSLSIARRLDKPERLERSESRDLGLRVFVGQRQAMVSTSERTPDALAELVERAVAMARVVPEDPHCGLADPSQLARDWQDFDLADPVEPSVDAMIAAASEAEAARRRRQRRHQFGRRGSRMGPQATSRWSPPTGSPPPMPAPATACRYRCSPVKARAWSGITTSPPPSMPAT